MKVITEGHKYELENFEPNRPANDVSKGLRRDAYELCHAIEACGCSEQVTKAVTLASALGDKIGILENGNQTLQFIEKKPDLEKGNGILFTVNNGTTNEEVINVLVDRLNSMQAKFPCRENAIATTHLETALLWLEKRMVQLKPQSAERPKLRHAELRHENTERLNGKPEAPSRVASSECFGSIG
jgi:hypothetical protein